MVKGVSYEAICASHRASVGYYTSNWSAPSSSQSPIYHAPTQSPPVIDLSPMPVQDIVIASYGNRCLKKLTPSQPWIRSIE